MTRLRGPSAVLFLPAPARDSPISVRAPADPPQVPALPRASRRGLDASRRRRRAKPESLVRLPGDPDSLFTLGGPGPSGQARVRLAVEVNEAALKLLAPDPKVESTDFAAGPGGDWKPIDSAGRPYQLRFGARLIW